MCGISGIYLSDTSDSLKTIQLMNNSLQHRGPDDEGYAFFDPKKNTVSIFGGEDTPENVFSGDFQYAPNKKYSGQIPIGTSVALAHRRLSIIDLSPAGHQPMCSQDERYWIVYNGEIYNYIELRQKLKQAGFRFCSNSDTEVLLYSYVKWGVEALNRFIGMFSFAIYDRNKQEIFLARDFFGIKPLYYTTDSRRFAFASEIKALLSLPWVKKTTDPQRIFDYLYSGLTDHGEGTMFSEIKQLPPGHFLKIQLANLKSSKPIQYWGIDLKNCIDISFGEATKNVRELFLKNLEIHLRSDVSVGAALSGGIDSSSIVMAMRHIQGPSLDIHTFSHIADDPRVCEEPWIDIIGSASSSMVHKVCPSADDLVNDIEKLIYYQDEPFGSTSMYAQLRVMQLARDNNIKVMLDGQGADELLAGYRGYWGARFASLVRHFKLIKALRFFVKTIKNGHSQPKLMLMQTGQYFLPRYLRAPIKRLVNVDLVSPWLRNDWFNERGVRPITYNTKGIRHFMREELFKSMTQGGLYALLRHEDRNSMAHSIESRVPFLTPKLTQFLFSLPEEYLLDMGATSKSVFRSAMRGIVPDAVLDRKDKIGFATAEEKWLKNLRPWIKKILHSETAQSFPAVNIEKFRQEWESVLSGKSSFDWRIWRFINMVKWIELTGAQVD